MSQVLIITGMHRSATSLIASLFGAGGVHLGAQLLEPDYRNPRGFFEDADFFAFHENLLLARGETILIDHPLEFLPTADEAAHAARLLAARATLPLWGWKDPRTCLFFDFWNERLPQAQWILVYRHPLEVLLSLMRRGDDQMPGLLRGLDAWLIYNEQLIEIRRRAPERTLLCHCYGVIDRLPDFQELVRHRLSLELTLDIATRNMLYRPNELRRALLTPQVDAILNQVHPQAMSCYTRLNELADLTAPDGYSADAPPALAALAQYAAALPEPPDLAARRSLLIALVALQEPDTFEKFAAEQWQLPATRQEELRQLNQALSAANQELSARRAERETLIKHIQELRDWATPRMEDLRALEAHPALRVLRRLGVVKGRDAG